MIPLIAALAIGSGMSLVAIGFLRRARDRDAEIASILELPFGDHDAGAEPASASHTPLFESGVAAADAALRRFKVLERVAAELERARIALRPGEYVLISLCVVVVGSTLAWALTSRASVGLMALVILPWACWQALLFKVTRRRKAFEQRLPDALGLVASSLEAGHTFLHAVETMVEESDPPISEEFERILAETRLGDSVVDALERTAKRLQIPDLTWVVQAIRIQQTVGGKLAELLNTLADFMRAREEVRREVRVLTAEGRLSAYVLGAMPVFVMIIIQMFNPEYMKPMFSGKGLVALFVAAGSVVTGIHVIKRMSRIDV
jgi:Flp pilus assembly protein TadB